MPPIRLRSPRVVRAMADLPCPVCRKNQKSLAQLNEHLDAAHPVGGETTPPKINDRTAVFQQIRQRQQNRLVISRTRLELRLVKLLIGLQNLSTSTDSYSQSGGLFWNWRDNQQLREFEQSVTVWEDEDVFERCRFCGQKFSLFLRKHHCRVCGLVTCGDTERECSLEVPANLLAQKLTDLYSDYPKLALVHTLRPLRICCECRSRLLSHRNFVSDCAVENIPPSLRLHKQLQRLQSSIEAALPEFQTGLASVAGKTLDPQRVAQLRSARQRLLQQFSKYEKVMQKLRSSPAETDTEARIQHQILAKSAQFLETTMLPLQSLPQAMRYSEVGAGSTMDKHTANKLQNQLVVLEEQQFLLQQQVVEAKNKRHFDALPPLEMSLQEIGAEIDNLSGQLGQYAPTN